jgi:hypothetical protein
MQIYRAANFFCRNSRQYLQGTLPPGTTRLSLLIEGCVLGFFLFGSATGLTLCWQLSALHAIRPILVPLTATLMGVSGGLIGLDLLSLTPVAIKYFNHERDLVPYLNNEEQDEENESEIHLKLKKCANNVNSKTATAHLLYVDSLLPERDNQGKLLLQENYKEVYNLENLYLMQNILNAVAKIELTKPLGENGVEKITLIKSLCKLIELLIENGEEKKTESSYNNIQTLKPYVLGDPGVRSLIADLKNDLNNFEQFYKSKVTIQ